MLFRSSSVVVEKKAKFESHCDNVANLIVGDYKKLLTPYVYRGFCVLVTVGGISMLGKVIYDYFIKKYSEDHTEFKIDSQINTALNRNEELIGATFSQKRVMGRVPDTWAIRTLHHPIAATNTIDELSLACNSNLRFCVIENNNRVTKVCVFGICNNFAIIPTHAVPDGDFVIKVSTTAFSATNCYKESIVSRKLIYDLGNDMTLISLSQVQFRNILKHLNNVEFSFLEGKISDSVILIRNLKNLAVSNPKGDYVVQIGRAHV